MELIDIKIEDSKSFNIVNGILLILKSNPKAIISTSAYGEPTLFVNREDYNSSLTLTEEEETLLKDLGWIKSCDNNNVVRCWEIITN